MRKILFLLCHESECHCSSEIFQEGNDLNDLRTPHPILRMIYQFEKEERLPFAELEYHWRTHLRIENHWRTHLRMKNQFDVERGRPHPAEMSRIEKKCSLFFDLAIVKQIIARLETNSFEMSVIYCNSFFMPISRLHII